jgi:AcrR family transcriptional regulator
LVEQKQLATFGKRSYTRFMQTPPRLLRAHADKVAAPRSSLAERRRERAEYIIEATQSLMATFIGDVITIGNLALALRTTPVAIRRHFADMDTILAEILVRHLTAVLRAIGEIPHDHPDRAPAQRAAYIAATRTAKGEFSEPHLLLIRKLHTLPKALAKPIEDMRKTIGEMLGGEQAHVALILLDTPGLPAWRVEDMLAASEAWAAAQAKPGDRKRVLH